MSVEQTQTLELTEEELASQAQFRAQLVESVVKAREDIIRTLDTTPVTRESAILAIDAMAGETLRVVESGPNCILAEDGDNAIVLEGLAEAFFDAVNN